MHTTSIVVNLHICLLTTYRLYLYITLKMTRLSNLLEIYDMWYLL